MSCAIWINDLLRRLSLATLNSQSTLSSAAISTWISRERRARPRAVLGSDDVVGHVVAKRPLHCPVVHFVGSDNLCEIEKTQERRDQCTSLKLIKKTTALTLGGTHTLHTNGSCAPATTSDTNTGFASTTIGWMTSFVDTNLHLRQSAA